MYIANALKSSNPENVLFLTPVFKKAHFNMSHKRHIISVLAKAGLEPAIFLPIIGASVTGLGGVWLHEHYESKRHDVTTNSKLVLQERQHNHEIEMEKLKMSQQTNNKGWGWPFNK
jgi:hypothetical protein